MDLQFHKSVMPCLRMLSHDTKCQEQTLEIKLAEEMPDIGKVISCWGQVIVRGKEWRSDDIRVSGGVMCWVLYQPEEGSQVRCVEGWIPFQTKWEFEQTQRDGTILVLPCIRGIDARSTSARKLMVRAQVNILCEAYVPSEIEVFTPGEIPADVHVLKRTYPVQIPAEAGEKAFSIEETLSLPSSAPGMDSVIRYSVQTELIDCKVMTDKVIFRGLVLLHILYMGLDGGLYTSDFEVPFSQFTQLESDNDAELPPRMHIAVTNSELDRTEEGNLNLKVSMTVQYVVYAMPLIEVVEDAYSNRRSVQVVPSECAVSAVLDSTLETLRAELEVNWELDKVVDIAFYPDHPRSRAEGDVNCAELMAVYKVLGYDTQGQLDEKTVTWEREVSQAMDPSVKPLMSVLPSALPQCTTAAGKGVLWSDMIVEMIATKAEGLPSASGLILGEVKAPDPARPSLILRRMGDHSLWEIAKETGSSVDAILAANHLQLEQKTDRFLLIPVQ